MQHRHLRFPEGKYKAFTMSYDDGWAQDKRFSDIVTPYGIKATFNIISRDIGKDKILTKDEIKEYIIERGHEIALHGAEHRANGLQRPIGGLQDILNCRLELEKEFGIIINSGGSSACSVFLWREKSRNGIGSSCIRGTDGIRY